MPAPEPEQPSDIERLRERLPQALFGPDAPVVPLVHDIARQIRHSMPSSIPDIAIQRLIASWTRRPAYKAAVERGEPPRNLDTTVPRCRKVDHVQLRELEDLLATTWPGFFGPTAEPAPLAIGVHKEIREALRDEPRCTTGLLSIFLTRWVRRPAYLQAVAAGVRRLHIDGSPADMPTEAERQHAAAEIERRFGGTFIPDARAA